MLLRLNCLVIVLLITVALSHPANLWGSLSRGPKPPPTVIQKNAPFYLQWLVSIPKIPWRRHSLDYQYHWNPSVAGQNVVVYVIDSGTSKKEILSLFLTCCCAPLGIDIENPEFEGRATNGWTYNNDYEDIDGHGTLCASIIGGKQFGVAKNVTLVSVVVWGPKYDEGDRYEFMRGLRYVLSKCKDHKHPCIASISLAVRPNLNGDTEFQDVDSTVEEVAAGNRGTDRRHSPAGIQDAITVGALDYHKHITDFSTYGVVDIWAYGKDIVGLFTGYTHLDLLENGLSHVDGTSAAAPQVAGIIALLISAHGNVTPKEMKKKVIEMGIKGKIKNLQEKPLKPYGPNVIAHISKELYNPQLLITA